MTLGDQIIISDVCVMLTVRGRCVLIHYTFYTIRQSFDFVISYYMLTYELCINQSYHYECINGTLFFMIKWQRLPPSFQFMLDHLVFAGIELRKINHFLFGYT